MKKLPVLLSALFLVFLVFSGCQKQSPVAPELNRENDTASLEKAEQIALEMIKLCNWEVDPEMKASNGSEISLEKVTCGPDIKFIDRLHVAADIYHYVWVMKMGPHPWDRVGIHRVIKERRHCRPIRTDKNIFLQHGDCKDFEGMFLPGTRSPNMPNDFGFAVFLAEQDVDVWGIDQAWTLVPEDASDFSFMMDWGLQKQVTDLRAAMQAAFFVRMLTGCGDNKLNLLGYSSGVWTGYALLNQESQYPIHRRVAGGFVAADGGYKTNDDAMKQGFLVDYNLTKSMYDQGQYGYWIPFATVGKLARTDPDGASPLFQGFTNFQAAMFYAAGPIFGTITFHYFAGIWENDFPVDLQYVTKDEYYDFMEAAVPWEATKFILDYEGIICDIGDLPFDDHLGEITVPILNLAMAGGLGELSKYTTTLLGSSDITNIIPSLHPPDEVLKDFAHIDMFLSRKAPTLVWRPALDWVNTH